MLSFLYYLYLPGTYALIFHWVQEIDQPALIPHIAEANSAKFPYEVLFRSLHKLLMDTASSEYPRVCPLVLLLNAYECLVNISLLVCFFFFSLIWQVSFL